jgi:hypothetical protein
LAEYEEEAKGREFQGCRIFDREIFIECQKSFIEDTESWAYLPQGGDWL